MMLYFGKKNTKLVNSALEDEQFFSFDLPAGVTCPCAGACRSSCYASSGRYIMFRAVKDRHVANYDAIKTMTGEEIEESVRATVRKYVKPILRLHTSGDFFSREYTDAWIRAARILSVSVPQLRIHAYTKSVRFFKNRSLPDNLTVVFSYGGTDDDLIDDTDRCALVIGPDDAVPVGYVNGSDSDRPALDPSVKRIALRYHSLLSWDKSGFKSVRKYREICGH